MIEMKELQALVVCADVRSFTKAAEILYTSQPNVSKMIRSLEGKLGFAVFYRDSRGIRLTQKGRQAYKYASEIISREEDLSRMLQTDSREEFCVATNPSSWVASFLTDFYRTCRRENVRYCFLEGGVNDVLEQVGCGKAEVGLIYYRKEQQAGIDYNLQKRGLVFEELKKLRLWLYYGGRAHPDAHSVQSVDLIQCYDDEFAFGRAQNFLVEGEGLENAPGRISVVTNSDYIMNRMLRETGLCNLSAEDVGTSPEFRGRAVREETDILFGAVIRKEAELSASAEELLKLLRERVQ